MMTADWWIDLILIVMLSVIVAQNMGLKDRLKKIEAKFDRSA
jgi:hypothetical protein